MAFFALLAVVIVGALWYLRQKERAARTAYFSQFKESDLRMSPYQIGLVYRILSEDGGKATAIPIWNGKYKVIKAKEETIPTDELIHFDGDRFF